MRNEYYNDEESKEVEASVENVEEELLASGSKYKIIRSGEYVEVYAATDLMSDEEKDEFYKVMKQMQNNEQYKIQQQNLDFENVNLLCYY